MFYVLPFGIIKDDNTSQRCHSSPGYT